MTEKTASKTTFDVIVVGAGPGGSACAMYLGNAGLRVLLLDKAVFPRDKTCGDAIGAKSQAVMRELGFLNEIESIDHAKIYGVLFSSPNQATVTIQFPDSDPQTGKGGYCIRREVFDDFVFQHAKAHTNVTAIEAFQVTELVQENGFVTGIKGTDIKTKQNAQFSAKAVVGADGASSIVATKLGLNAVIPDHDCLALRAYYDGISGMTPNIEIHFVDSLLPGYFWIFPLENGRANVGVGMVTKDIKSHKISLQKEMFSVIENHPMFKERFRNATRTSDVKGWRLPFGSYRRKVNGNGWVLIGDAASLVDPFSGEGISNAMYSGKIAAEQIISILKDGKPVTEEALAPYTQKLWATLGNELSTSYKLQRIGRNKFLLNLVVGRASRSKKMQEMISGMLGNEEVKKELTGPLFYLKLMFA
ncbi:MAG: geranylgeranyl reductase family protein [Candidatus Diapherotrites archaeon]|nr:geranylgeranyl reductase family protein [Candidatus Diapherotrites archaeon]